MKTRRPPKTSLGKAAAARSIGILLLLLVAGGAAGQQGAAEPPGDAPFAAYLSWLRDNPAHDAFGSVMLRSLDAAASVGDLEALANDALPLLADQDLLHAVAVRLASVFRTAHRYTPAIELYETAFFASGLIDLESLFLQAQLLLETGQFSAAEQRARTVVAAAADYELKRRAYALAARVMHLTGRSAEAERLLETLASLDDPALVEPETLILQSAVRAAAGLGDPSVPIAALRRLHPRSVAVALLEGGRYRSATLPSGLLLAALLPRAAGPAPTALQVGSFTDPDNAMHLMRDLEALGLSAQVSRRGTEGNTLHLVTVDLTGDGERDPDRVLALLRRAGLDGFPVY